MAHNSVLAGSANYSNVKEEFVSEDNDQLTATEAVLWSTQGPSNHQTDLEELYAGHVVKEELVIGPEVLQQADSNVTAAGTDTDKTSQSEMGIVNNEKTNEIYKEITDCSTMELKIKSNKAFEVEADVNERKNNQMSHHIESLNIFKDNKMNPAKHFICNECEYQTVSRELLKKHLKLHDTSRMFVCDTCGLRFKTKQSVISHINRHHRTAKAESNIFECELTRNGVLEKHIICACNIEKHKSTCRSNGNRKLKELMDEKTFSCTYCKYSCSRSHGLKRHLRTHTGERPYTCTFCNYRCSENGGLKRHLRTHTGEKPYACTYCHYRYSQMSCLTQHLRKHTGEKPYTCTYCNYSCIRMDNLKLHLRKHTGEKPYNCKYCNYSSSKSCNLKQHLKKHSVESPYTCTYCNYSCRRNGFLKQHLSTHTDV